MENTYRLGLLFLLVALLGCSGATDDADSDDNESVDVVSPDDVSPAPPPPDSDDSSPPLPPETDGSSAPPIEIVPPVALPEPTADEELRRHAASLYNEQIRGIVEEATRMRSTGSANTAEARAALRQAVDAKLAEADELRKESVAYFHSLGVDAFEKLKAAMRDKSADVRRGATWYLFENINKDDPQMVAVFVLALDDEDRTIRQMALAGLASLPPESLVQFAPQLTGMLKGGRASSADRADVAKLIGRLKSHAESALPTLVELAHADADPEVRKQCLYAASRIADDRIAVGMFRRALADPDVAVRKLAAVRLGSLGEEAGAAVAELASALSDADADVRQYAADSLAKLGPPRANAAIDQLVATLGDKNQDVYLAAARALLKIGEPSVAPLIKQLDSPDASTRRVTVYTLGSLGKVSAPAAPALRKLRNDPDEEVRELVTDALDLIDPQP